MEMPQSSVEGLGWDFFFFSLSLSFFLSAGGGNNIPFYCRISRTEAAMGLPVATRAQQAPPGPLPSTSRRDAGSSGRWDLLPLLLLFPPSLTLRCFFFRPPSEARRDADGRNYSPIKDKDVTWEAAGAQQLAGRHAEAGEGAVSIKCVSCARMNGGWFDQNSIFGKGVKNRAGWLMTSLTFILKHSLYILFSLSLSLFLLPEAEAQYFTQRSFTMQPRHSFYDLKIWILYFKIQSY